MFHRGKNEKKFFYLCLLIFIITLFSVSFNMLPKKQLPPESDFYREFSPGKIVEQMKVPELAAGSGGGSGGESFGGKTVQRESEYHHIYHFANTLGAQFDEANFLKRFGDEIENAAVRSGARITGKSLKGGVFFLSYSTDKHQGGVKVVGMKIENVKYSLRCLIHESTGN